MSGEIACRWSADYAGKPANELKSWVFTLEVNVVEVNVVVRRFS